VLRGDDPVPGARVKLLPDPENRHRPDLLIDAWTNEDGHFVIKNLAPGSYRALAAPSERDYENDDDDFPASVSIVLSEKESKSVQLKLHQADNK
jgi:hypothetical protein